MKFKIQLLLFLSLILVKTNCRTYTIQNSSKIPQLFLGMSPTKCVNATANNTTVRTIVAGTYKMNINFKNYPTTCIEITDTNGSKDFKFELTKANKAKNIMIDDKDKGFEVTLR